MDSMPVLSRISHACGYPRSLIFVALLRKAPLLTDMSHHGPTNGGMAMERNGLTYVTLYFRDTPCYGTFLRGAYSLCF
jgi:hypothetical protein